jgi:hypothetical protein
MTEEAFCAGILLLVYAMIVFEIARDANHGRNRHRF